MTSITKKEIEHIAKLSSLPLKDSEITKLKNLLSETINYVNVLNELDTSNTKETYQVNNLKNVYQNNIENTCTLSKEDSLKNAKLVEDGLFVSKGVFSE